MHKTTQGIALGKRDVKLTAPSHVRGVHQGNRPTGIDRERFLHETDGLTTGSARRSTSINPEDREPIHPDSPRLSPA